MKNWLLGCCLTVVLVLLGACAGLGDQARLPLVWASKAPSKGWALVPPQVRIFVKTPLGPELDGEWSASAERLLTSAAMGWSRNNGFNPSLMPSVAERDKQSWTDWLALYQTVTSNALFVAKMNQDVWRSGSGASRYTVGPVPKFLTRQMRSNTLLLLSVSAFASSSLEEGGGLAQMQIMAGLVDTASGDVLWLNTKTEPDDDIRTAPGAAKVVANLLSPLVTVAK